MSREAYDPPPISGWLARELKLTLFPAARTALSDREWWKELTQTEPDESIKKKGVTTQTGVWREELRLTVSVSMDIIQWAVDRVDPTDPDEVPVLGSVVESLSEFIATMSEWLPNSPPLRRMGLGANALFPVSDHATGYRLLNTLLRTVDVNPATSGFDYGINRPTRLRMDDSVVNDLTGWTCFAIPRMSSMPSSVPPIRLEPRFYGNVSLDMNTEYDRERAFTVDQSVAVLAELSALVVARLTKGDTDDDAIE